MECIRRFARLCLVSTFTPRFTGEGVWRYNVPRPPDVDYGSIYATPEGPKAGLIPLTRETAYIFRIGPRIGNPRFPKNELADIMRDRLKPFGGPIGELARQITDPELVVYRPLESVFWCRRPGIAGVSF